ncbi:MAG: gfo/Idh/MocA family oxidoreductase [Spirochaetaceae bacterium]|nr:MAG: gfo/Idh/MocA family oxidoreductase [Spirochaetaceae bacterium]
MELKPLKLGVIGLSEGNGHPYSWSAIVNGDFSMGHMKDCGFPVIPAYLDANRETLGVDYAEVTHIWTQDRAVSEHVAAAAGIPTIVEKMEDMIGSVDAVLLARDDPENHVAMAKPFVDAGVPIFIDKPLAFSRDDLEWFATKIGEGKFIMSSSALRYSPGVQANRERIPELGALQLAVAVGPKDLRKYAVHYLEGMLALLDDPVVAAVKHVSGASGKDVLHLEFDNGMLGVIGVFKNIAGGELNIYGAGGTLSVMHGGAYTSFRNHLVEAIHCFRTGKSRLPFEKTWNVIATLCAARESLENGGARIEVGSYSG